MTFWLIVLFAAACAALGFKRRDFYRMWAIVFNVSIAIYTSIMLSPWIISMIPTGTSGLQYQKVACIVCIAVLVFGLLQAITVNFITTDFEITFPKLFDTIGSSVLGFVGGWVICSFLLLMISIMPFAEKPFLEKVTGKKTTKSLAITPIVALCDFITAVSIQPPQGKPLEVINQLTNSDKPENIESETIKTKLEHKIPEELDKLY